MANIEIRVESIEPFADGHGFGEAGPYLRMRVVARGELDPAVPQNAVIVDLDRAPRNAGGRVEYEIFSYCGRKTPAGPVGCWSMT
jgi:hypothetical protein